MVTYIAEHILYILLETMFDNIFFNVDNEKESKFLFWLKHFMIKKNSPSCK